MIPQRNLIGTSLTHTYIQRCTACPKASRLPLVRGKTQQQSKPVKKKAVMTQNRALPMSERELHRCVLVLLKLLQFLFYCRVYSLQELQEFSKSVSYSGKETSMCFPSQQYSCLFSILQKISCYVPTNAQYVCAQPSFV